MFKMDNNYKIGIYIRLSREDGDDLESESIGNQRSLLNGFLASNNLECIEEYVDDGYSGGNFNRPSFQKMIRDIESKKINCVITKDLSRLGRDYIDTGRYVERYFPEKGVRYIALNDDIDTIHETSGSEMMPFKLSMNDMYAKDISKKVRSHLMIMKQEGKFCGSVPPFGYIRDPENKYHLIKDPKTYKIVKKIFELYIAGYGTVKIADILTKEGYPTPVMLKNSEKKLNKCNHPEIWKNSSVNNILKNKVYTGCLIQHRTQKINYKTKKRRKVPKQEWCIVNNTHEAIIDLNSFKIAESIRDSSNNYDKNRRNKEYVLSKIVYCKDCGAKMTISYDKKRDRTTMNCNNYRKFSKYGICSSHFVNYEKLESTIFNSLKNLAYNYKKNIDIYERIIKKDFLDPKEEILKKINNCQKEINNLIEKQDELYNDKFSKIIDLETYQRLNGKASMQIDKLNDKLKKLQEELSKTKSVKRDNKYKDIINSYFNFQNPTREMINKIIEKIYVTKDKQIEIYYRIKKVSKC